MEKTLRECLERAKKMVDKNATAKILCTKAHYVGGCPSLAELTKEAEALGKDFSEVNVSTADSNGFDGTEIYLSWEEKRNRTQKEIEAYKRKRFTNVAYRFVYDALTASGYKRVVYDTANLRRFDGTTIYDLFIEENYESLLDYYSLGFTKE